MTGLLLAIERIKRNFSRNSDVMEIVRALEWRLEKEERTARRVFEMKLRAKERKFYAGPEGPDL